ncbi:MAG: class B sortase [Oscillospiraceae bacterium]|nr:class B sortase [Oscillospiraceae bacterium]
MEQEKKKEGKLANFLSLKVGRISVAGLLYCLAIAILGGVFIFSSAYLINYWVDSRQAGSDYDDLASRLESLRATTPTQPETTAPPNPATDPNTGITDSKPTEPTEPQILPEYLPFYELNNDMVGWITIADTKVNYPVMQTPDNPDYYLKRNFYKMSSDWGAIYARESCDINRPSDNITLYGHHMKDGSMFAQLHKFQSKDFWQTHQTFTFDTLYEHHTYTIWAVFKTSANITENYYPYHRFSDAATEEEFNEFVQTIKKMDYYDTGITPVYGDKLVTLSTCEYTLDNGRFVVCAVRTS